MQLYRAHGTLLAWLLGAGRSAHAAPWCEFLGGSEQRFNGLVSENNQGGYCLEACWPGLIATCRADALHDLLAAELLQVVGRPGGTTLCECLLAEHTDPCREIGSGEAVGNGGQGNDRFGDPAHRNPGMRFPVEVIDGSASFRSWPGQRFRGCPAGR
jgi:hypothetical protein